jgi:transcriptional antiterminator RfaH
MVRFGGEAAKVDERLIDILRMHEKAEQNHPQKLFTPGETVLIIEGPFAGLEAVYQMEDAESRAMILIELLSKPVKMSIEPENLRKVEVLPC